MGLYRQFRQSERRGIGTECSNHMNPLEKRIDELEMRVAHQDKTISELNDVITAQWKKTDALERQLRRLGEELQALDSNDAPANQKPPHY
jgi:SlyX protein